MNNFTEQERIEQFSKLMKSYVSEEFKKWLIDKGFLQPPLLFITTGHIRGRCSIIPLQ